jgi:hypothetical protein
MSQRSLRIDRLIVIALALGLTALGLQAHEGEEHAGAAAEAESDTLMQELPAEKVDSLYADINIDFLTIRPILKQSCYDCHSTQTEYPWYHSLPIVKGFMDDHIKHGRGHLDMTNGFPFNEGKKDQMDLLADMKDEIKEGDMPILSYRLMHWGTLIEGKQQDSVFGWIDRTQAKLTAFGEQYPAFLKAQAALKTQGREESKDHDEDEL